MVKTISAVKKTVPQRNISTKSIINIIIYDFCFIIHYDL